MVDWCGNTTTPPSGLYINQLPGITFKGLQSIADSEQITFASVWDDIQTRAIRRFELDVRQKLSAKWALSTIQNSLNTGTKIEDANLQTLTNTLAYGYEIDLDCTPDDDYLSSLLQEIVLQQLFVFTTAQPGAAVTARVIVFDINSGYIIKDTTQSIAAATFKINGWTKINTDLNFTTQKTDSDFNIVNNAQKYFVGVNFSSNISTKELVLTSNLTNICDCCNIKFRPANVTVVTTPNTYYGATINYTDNAYGLSAILNSRCNWTRLVCSNKDLFATAFWYLLGIETMNEQMYSERLNRYTTIDLKKAEQKKRELELEYQGGIVRSELGDVIKTVKGALTQAVETIDLDCSDCCVECEGELKLMETTL